MSDDLLKGRMGGEHFYQCKICGGNPNAFPYKPEKEAFGFKGNRKAANLTEQPTLRDQFAMAALTGLASLPLGESTIEDDVRDSYRYADLMLRIRTMEPSDV